jgi:hypothetical protein
MMLVGNKKELILLARKPRSRQYTLVCFGAKRHYRKDGSCRHTAALLTRIKPELLAKVVVTGFGGKKDTP